MLSDGAALRAGVADQTVLRNQRSRRAFEAIRFERLAIPSAEFGWLE